MPKARVKLPEELVGLLRSDLERVIREANLGREDTAIAIKYLIRQIPQVDIAADLEIERSTISRRLQKIMQRLRDTARKIS